MKFLDFTSGRYFIEDENILMKQLKELEERSQNGEILLWSDYYKRIGLPNMAFGKQPMIRKEYGDVLKFKVIPFEDYMVIHVLRYDES